MNSIDGWYWPTEKPSRPWLKTSGQALVVFDPWVNEVIDRVEVEISEDGDYGSSLRIVATAKVPALPDEQRRRVRYRLGAIFGGALREWVDDPH